LKQLDPDAVLDAILGAGFCATVDAMNPQEQEEFSKWFLDALAGIDNPAPPFLRLIKWPPGNEKPLEP
jgi:hypothetical protein